MVRTSTNPFLDDLGRMPMLTKEEALTATRDARVGSVGPMIIMKTAQFSKTLGAREKASGFELEDVAMDLYADLLSKDHLWEPARGSYTTFAGTILDNKLTELRNDSHPVPSPRGSNSRLRSIAESSIENSTSSAHRLTEKDILRATGGAEEAESAFDMEWSSDTLAELEAMESMDGIRHLVAVLAPKLACPWQQAVMCLEYGLGRSRKHTNMQIAEALSMPVARVTAVRFKAYKAIMKLALEDGMEAAPLAIDVKEVAA